MLTVSVRYKNPFSPTDAVDVADYLSELLEDNPTARFYLIVAENRMFAVGAVKDEKSERWQVKQFRYIRDDKFRPHYLYFAPFCLPQCEYCATFYGGVMGKVEREGSAPLNFYLVEGDLRLKEWETKAGATKEAVWEIFVVENEAGRATIRPLLSEADPMVVVLTPNTSIPKLQTILTDYVEEVFEA